MTGWAGLGDEPLVMGILNTTPDSFSDGGDHLDPARAIAAGAQMLADGVDIIDVGGESTRPGSVGVSLETEQARVIPVVRALVALGAVVSIDTRNSATMASALDAGARIVNDVSALTHDPSAPGLVAARGCPVVLMHMRGTPATMNRLAVYDDVVAEVRDKLAAHVATALAAGVHHAAIAIDPGFGFAKDDGHNLILMRGLSELLAIRCPIVAGISRKATIGMLGGETDPRRRGPGSVAAGLFAMTQGAHILRVHDVWETVQALRVWRGIDPAGPR